MKPRILFVDDMTERHEAFLSNASTSGYKRTCVFTYDVAIQYLSKMKFDIVSLDHDLGGKVMCDPDGVEKTGTHIAQWMSDNLPIDRHPTLVIIHSHNPSGSERMQRILDAAGFKTQRRPFGMR